jgi:uncharacterized membrane protein
MALHRGSRVLQTALRCALALCVVLAGVSAAAARTLTIRSFKADVTVQQDGTIDVSETIVAYFAGSWNGLYRTIPIEYETAQGLNYSLFVSVVTVTDGSGEDLRYETSRANGYLKVKIYVPNAVDSAHTIQIHYRASDALRFFEDHDELYWNITGNDWDEPIQAASGRITLPAGTTGLHALAFTGSYGSQSQDAQVETTGSIVSVAMTRALAFHEGLTVVVGWDKGFVHQPTKSEEVMLFLRSNWPLCIPIIAFFVMLFVWYTRGRDPRHRAIAVQYEPPDGLTPGEVGTLVDNSAAMRDITATLVDLAVRGYLTIEEKQVEHMMGLYNNKSYTFHLKKPAAQWTDLRPHEADLMSALFDGGASDSVDLHDLQNHFYKHIPEMRDALFDSLLQRHYYIHRPDYVRTGWIGGAVVMGVLIVLLGSWLANSQGIAMLPFVISAIATGAVIAGFGWFMPTHTGDGMRALEGALGFEDFLQHVESDRIARIEKTPAMFEKFLPYAMALGVEKKWVGAFGDICKEPPSWYQGGAYGPNFVPLYFIASLNSMAVQTASVMASAPRSVSGGSGFGGGGGFSGGGFGGGGGGGF